MEKESNITKSVYKHGAEQGVVFGIYLTLVSMAMFYSGASTLLSLVALVMVLAMPGVLFVIERRYYRALNGCADVSSMWLLGLMTALFGSLICAVADYVWLQYVEPGFILQQAQGAIDAYKQLPEFSETELVASLQQAIDGGLLPTPIEFVVNMILFTTFVCSVLSLIAALIVSSVYAKKRVMGQKSDKDIKL